ncbi:MAG TPA: APC family permease [Ktedonobacteraceae bacterium]|jgi:amino acid transporter|nr:APC family permease [Ktedonobacteraceae bacterium]
MALFPPGTQGMDPRPPEKYIERGASELRSETYIPQVLPAVLRPRDLLGNFIVALFLLPNAILTATGGTVSLSYILLGAAFFFLPCAIATAQLGKLYPHDGSLYVWTYRVFGGAFGSFLSFFVGLCYWLSAVFATVTAANAAVTIVNGMNNSWLAQPWQQGLAMVFLLLVASFICRFRLRVVQNLINISACATLLTVFLVVLAGILWLAQGHTPQTNLASGQDWLITPASFSLFGIIVLNFIGTSGPLNMAAEIPRNEPMRRKALRLHLGWGSMLIFACYFLVPLMALLVRGQSLLQDTVITFAGFGLVDMVLGKSVGDIALIGFGFFCVFASVFYMLASSRILFAAAVDGRIPGFLARLNRNRVPMNAIRMHVGSAIFVVLGVFDVFPFIVNVANSAVFTAQVYTVISAALTLIWTIATLFYFVNIIGLFVRHRSLLTAHRVVPVPILMLCSLLGFLMCVLTIVACLVYSWIPSLLSNTSWSLYVGFLTAISLLIAGVISIVASGQADWESLLKREE